MSYSLRQLKNLFVENEKISVVFFVGRGKTHRTELNFRRMVVSLAALGAIGIWGILGLVSSVFLIAQNTHLGEQLQERKNQVFSYQSQFEQLFEIAYQLIEEKPKVEPEKIVDDDKTNNWQPAITSSQIYLHRFNLLPLDRGNQVNISLRNGVNETQKGYTWILAKVRLKDGVAHYISAPHQEIITPKDGTMLDIELAKKFQFRKQWNSEFTLEVPQTMDGSIEYMTLYIADLEGKIILRHTVQPVTKPDQTSVSH